MFYLIVIVAIGFMWGLIVIMSFFLRRRQRSIEQGLNEQPDSKPSLPAKAKHFKNSKQ